MSLFSPLLPGHLSARPPDTCQPDARPDACPLS